VNIEFDMLEPCQKDKISFLFKYYKFWINSFYIYRFNWYFS